VSDVALADAIATLQSEVDSGERVPIVFHGGAHCGETGLLRTASPRHVRMPSPFNASRTHVYQRTGTPIEVSGVLCELCTHLSIEDQGHCE
jgi:hypothetical protein